MTTPITSHASVLAATLRTAVSTRTRLLVDGELWLFTAALAAVVALGMWDLGWHIEWRPVVWFGGCLVALLSIALFYERSGRSDALARMASGLAAWLAMAFTCQAATYVFATTGTPFRDAELRVADAVLGFSWIAWAGWVREHPFLHATFAGIYPLHLVESAIAVLVLYHRSRSSGGAFVRAFALSFLISLLGLVVVPALGNVPEARSVSLRLALQEGTFKTFDIVRTTGLISMPSFHAVLAALVTIAMWPYARIRWWALAINVVMLAATISEGGHYIVDVLAGIALAFGAAWYARMPAMRWRPATDLEALEGAIPRPRRCDAPD